MTYHQSVNTETAMVKYTKSQYLLDDSTALRSQKHIQGSKTLIDQPSNQNQAGSGENYDYELRLHKSLNGDYIKRRWSHHSERLTGGIERKRKKISKGEEEQRICREDQSSDFLLFLAFKRGD